MVVPLALSRRPGLAQHCFKILAGLRCAAHLRPTLDPRQTSEHIEQDILNYGVGVSPELFYLNYRGSRLGIAVPGCGQTLRAAVRPLAESF